MPIYEYQCQSCGHEMEALQKISDDPLKVCPACNEPELTKLVSAASFRLKGGGWYETDFKTGDKKQLADSDSGAKSSDSSKSSSSSESKGKDTKSAKKENEKAGKDKKSKPANAG